MVNVKLMFDPETPLSADPCQNLEELNPRFPFAADCPLRKAQSVAICG
jgi:hypothetical protein